MQTVVGSHVLRKPSLKLGLQSSFWLQQSAAFGLQSSFWLQRAADRVLESFSIGKHCLLPMHKQSGDATRPLKIDQDSGYHSNLVWGLDLAHNQKTADTRTCMHGRLQGNIKLCRLAMHGSSGMYPRDKRLDESLPGIPHRLVGIANFALVAGC